MKCSRIFGIWNRIAGGRRILKVGISNFVVLGGARFREMPVTDSVAARMIKGLACFRRNILSLARIQAQLVDPRGGLRIFHGYPCRFAFRFCNKKIKMLKFLVLML